MDVGSSNFRGITLFVKKNQETKDAYIYIRNILSKLILTNLDTKIILLIIPKSLINNYIAGDHCISDGSDHLVVNPQT